ncbi:MAG: DUF3570 domain-containing protein [Natronospirillum sp.]|uniref:DUF3570 domain-containing protein n=1 Tax=Natronospirillum sp. TaxID=2812955 RepID=UPI0025D05BBA|nr:DUF3570 domain-containing protein [Natronospirillum sp.]MCH8552005.1 DUF3570 domain-containing protein [Natronospirillum sp.]
MAATDQRNIRGMLALATTGLLGQAAAQDFANDWTVNLAYLNYFEPDRVNVQSFYGKASGQISDDAHISVGVVLDTMTGATPSGAVEGSNVVANTGTSGGGFEVDGTSSSLADFDDTRLAVDLDWEHTYGRFVRVNYGAYASVEGDFAALGASVKGNVDLNNRNTTLALGLGAEGDQSSQRDGRTPEPMSNVTDQSFYGEGRRNTYDVLLGVTQVLGRRTIAQVNLTYTHSLGYHNDPYKVFSRADEDDVEAERYYENRPDERIRGALYTSLRHQLTDGDIIGGSLRYYQDDWGVEAVTGELSYRLHIAGRGSYVEPFGRAHYQTEADFYLRTLGMDEELPEYASADARLGELQAYTGGLKFSQPVLDWGTLQIRGSYYYQRFEDANYDDNQAFIAQLGFEFGSRYR